MDPSAMFRHVIRCQDKLGMSEPKNKRLLTVRGDPQPPPLASLDTWKGKGEQPPPLVQHSTRGVHTDSALPNIQRVHTNIPNPPEHGRANENNRDRRSGRPRGNLPLLAARRFLPLAATCRYLPRAPSSSRQVAATCGYLPRDQYKRLPYGK